MGTRDRRKCQWIERKWEKRSDVGSNWALAPDRFDQWLAIRVDLALVGLYSAQTNLRILRFSHLLWVLHVSQIFLSSVRVKRGRDYEWILSRFAVTCARSGPCDVGRVEAYCFCFPSIVGILASRSSRICTCDSE